MKNVFTKLNKNIFLMMCLGLSLAVITSCGDDDDDPMTGEDPSTVSASFTSAVDASDFMTYTFTNTSSVTGITDTSFDSSWEFGGDGASMDASTSHTFSAEGTYTVTLTVTASDGETGTATEEITIAAPKNKYAVITDSRDDDTGELRYNTDAIANGKVTFMYQVAAGPGGDIADGFINVSGTSTSGDDAVVEVRIKDDEPHSFREGASDADDAAANFPVGMPNVWVPVEVSWTTDGTTTPLYTVIWDGETIIADGVSTTNGGPGDVDGHLAATIDGAVNFQWKYNSNSSVSDGVFHVDDIVIYSIDAAGDATMVFSDDFQARAVGFELSSSVNATSPYHENTVDATVGEE